MQRPSSSMPTKVRGRAALLQWKLHGGSVLTWGLPPRVRRVKKAIERRREALARMELAFKVKDDLKTVALGTSKINYLDPRITVAWCKLNEARASRHAAPQRLTDPAESLCWCWQCACMCAEC